MHTKKKKRTPLLPILLGVLVVLALLAAVFFARRAHLFAAPATAEQPLDTVTVTLVPAQGEAQSLTVVRGEETLLPDGADLDGYTFLRWLDRDGKAVTGPVTLESDASFAAEYAIALETEEHIPYLDMTEEGLFRAADPFTHADAVIAVGRLLKTDKVGSGSFHDVDSAMPCYPYAATLKTLGALSGARLHPNDPTTLGEFLELLGHFYPLSYSAHSFSDLDESDTLYPLFCTAVERGWIEHEGGAAADPERDLTRLEAAAILNRVLGRGGEKMGDVKLVGTILDLASDTQDYWTAAEAALPHSYRRSESGAEQWTKSEALPLHESGLFFVGSKLHAIDENGVPLVNTSLGNIAFGSDGAYTTGNVQLDELVFSILQEQVDPETMSGTDMLRILYDYVVKNCEYLRRNYYEVGDTSWVADEAYTMLSEHKGNCYNYSAAFAVLARAIGYDATVISGRVIGGAPVRDRNGNVIPNTHTPHAWVEIVVDGTWELFDPNMEDTSSKHVSMYGRGESVLASYGYLYE